jgi:(heptosyl)LPS beta-1,4-glucosyltransferase
MNSGNRVTVVIAARDEAANIVACIDSVRWASEIIVVENDSSDGTAELATQAGAQVLRHSFTTIGGQRNAAIERASSEWVLVVDADERGSPELGMEIASVIESGAGPDAYRVRRRNYFMGSEIRHGGWGRDAPVRLFRSRLRYTGSRVHEHVETAGAVGELKHTLIHAPYASVDQYFEKLDRYSRWWAEDRFERGERVSALKVVSRPQFRFLTMYVLKAGFLDGAAGAVLACMAAASVFAKYAKLWGMNRQSGASRR